MMFVRPGSWRAAWRTARVRLLATAALALIAGPAPTHGATFETPPAVAAAELAPANLLRGEGFQVEERATTDGLSAHFVLHSDVGDFDAQGVQTLGMRVAELPALRELSRASKTETFLKAIGATAKKPIESAARMVMHPVDTAKGVPGGLGRFFDRVGSGAERLAAVASDASRSGGDRAGDVAGMTGSVTADALGYEKELRSLAKRLSVDPYTTNDALAEKLQEFARVAFAGHVGMNALITVAVPVSIAISGTNVTHDLVYDTPRGDLIVRNETRLRSMGASDDALRALQRAPGFTLSVQTSLVEALARLDGVAGRPDVVALAATAENADQALFLTRAVERLARHHAESVPLASLIARGTVIGRESGGRIVVPGPVDLISWTERIARFAQRDDLASPERVMLISGKVSERARSELTALGWTIVDGNPRG